MPVIVDGDRDRRHWKPWAAAGAALVVIAVVIPVLFNRMDSGSISDRDEAAATQLQSFKETLGREPSAPSGAVLVSRQETSGDGVSDGPHLTWHYQFEGAREEFADHLRATLVGDGWREIPVARPSPQDLVWFAMDKANVAFPHVRLRLTQDSPLDSYWLYAD
jgi:hypothetical protein